MTAIFVQDLEERQVNVKLEAKESGSLTPFKGSCNFCSFFLNLVCFVNSQLWDVSGFLVMAFDVSSADTAAPIGSFVPVDIANMVDCSGRENSAATHKDNSPKETVELKWIPPQGFVGDVMFRTTFVQDRTTFWVQEPSSVIQLPQLPIQLPEAPIQAPEAPIPIQEAPIQVQEAPIPIQEAPIQVQEAPIPIQEAPIQIQEAPIQIQASPMEPAKVLEANVGSIAAQPMNLITICGIFSVCMAIRLLI